MINENTLTILNSFPCDLQIVKELVYDICNLKITNPSLHSESKEYGACSFILNEKFIQHRISKITPTKKGQFVTIWKRNIAGITAPFEESDDLDFLLITAREDKNFGQFIFPKAILIDKGIISQNEKQGKRGIRVYPPWCTPTNAQGIKTQNWQTNYFLTINAENLPSLDLVSKLFNKK